MLSAGKRHRHDLDVDVFTAARQRMLYTYEKFDTVVISWSDGKDSTSCLELAREAARKTGKLPVHVMFMDEEVIYPETIDLVERHRNDPELQIYWCCVPSIYRNACSEVEPDFIPFDPTKRDLWTHTPPPDAVWPAGFDENGLPNMTTWRVPPSIPKRIIHTLFSDRKRFGRVGADGVCDRGSTVVHNVPVLRPRHIDTIAGRTMPDTPFFRAGDQLGFHHATTDGQDVTGYIVAPIVVRDNCGEVPEEGAGGD